MLPGSPFYGETKSIEEIWITIVRRRAQDGALRDAGPTVRRYRRSIRQCVGTESFTAD